VKAGGKKHYFGSVVYVNDGDSSIVIDGQQRATSVLLMITAIYHLAEEHPEKSAMFADHIKDDYLYNKYAKRYGTEENRIKLRAVTTDNEIFEKIFSKAQLTDREKDSKLYKAYTFFYDYFRDRNELHTYIDALEDFEIVTIILDKDDDNPQKVFESINSTGKALTDGDKIRNFALMLNSTEKQGHVLENYWQHIEKALTDTKDDFITDFFRVYAISSSQAIIKLDAVYPEFKKLFAKHVDDDQSIESLDKFYGDILESLKFYRFLKFGIDENSEFAKFEPVAFVMRYLRIELYFPFAISALKYHKARNLNDDDELVGVFDLIRKYFSRRLVANLLSTSLDRYFASLHRDVLANVEQHEVSYIEALKYSMLSRSGQTRMPRDAEVEAGIKANSAYTQRTTNVMYLLTSVDDESKDLAQLKQIAKKDVNLTIEHIMPQTLTDAWRRELGENAERVHDTYLHGLANLTLTGYNSEYSNRSFQEKLTTKDGFRDSPLKINKSIVGYEAWDEEALLDRQKWWVKKILGIWPLPSTSFSPPKADTRVGLFDEIDFKGKGIRMLHVHDDSYPVTNWAQALDTYCEYLYDRNSDFIEKVAQDDDLRVWFDSDPSRFFNSAEIYDSKYYVDTGTNTNRKVRLMKNLATAFGIESAAISLELDKPLNL